MMGWQAARPLTPDGLQQLTAAFGITVIADQLGGYTHNAAIHLVDPEGRLVDIFDLGDLNPITGDHPAESQPVTSRRWSFPVRLAALLVLVLLAPPVRRGLEATMTTQMLVQIPLLVAAGWLLSRAFPPASWREWNDGITAASPDLYWQPSPPPSGCCRDRSTPRRAIR